MKRPARNRPARIKPPEHTGEIREAFAPDGHRILAGGNQRWETDASAQETDLSDGWTVREEFAVQDGRRIVTSLTIRPTVAGTVPAGGVTARLLRVVKVGQFAAGLRQMLAKFYGVDAADRIFDGIGWASRPRRRKRPARLRADDRFYAELARDYVTWCQVGERKPTAALAAARGVPPEVMRSHIHLARKNGFLTDTGRGKAGGALTEKAHRALARKTPPAAERKNK
jgi:hypothetical protein